MKNNFLKIISVGLIFLCIGCSKSLYKVWTTDSVLVDGELGEWEINLFKTKSNLTYGVKQNDDFVFVAVSTDDERLLKKALLFGMTIWIDTRGKKNKTQGILYPKGLLDDETKDKMKQINLQEIREGKKLNFMDRETMILKLRGKTDEIGLINFYGFEDNTARFYNEVALEFRSPLKYAHSFTPGIGYTMEMAIPKSSLKKFQNKSKSGRWAIGFSIKPPEMNAQLQGKNMDRLPPRIRSRMQQSGKIQRFEEMKQMTEPVEFWERLDLSAIQ